MLKIKSVAGPASYAAGGFTVRFGEFEKVLNAMVVCDRSQVLETSDYAFGLRATFTGNTVTIVVVRISVVAATPTAWAEIPDASVLSARTFTAIVDAE